MRKYIYYILALVSACGLAACSTTEKLAEGEVLYTGVKKLKVNAPKDVEVPSGVESNISTLIDVPANNSLYSPYIRTPFPVGLWLYNHWSPNSKGVKGWIYRKFVEEPVLMSDVRPDLRVKMIDDMLDKNGFFGSAASYELLYDKKNPKKARVNYTVNLAVPKVLSEVRYLNDTTELSQLVNRFAKTDSYLQPGTVYCTDSLANVRNKITDRLRNRGYYFFRPEYLMYWADTTIVEGGVVVQMRYSDNMPDAAKRKYKVGNVNTRILLNKGGGYPDTTYTENGMIVQMQPSNLRSTTIPSCITLEKGKVLRVRQLSTTQSYLSRLGIFSAISLTVTPIDSVKSDSLDIDILCRFDTQLETQLEANVTSKSNSYLGPGLSYSVTNRNIFGGGERLTVKLTGAYEWQVGKVSGGKRSDFNSYEVGLNGELAFPRLLAPRFIPAIKREMSWTRVSLGGDIMNRPHFFRIVQFNTGLNYDWMSSRYSRNQVKLFELKYNKLLKTTADFDATMEANPAIAMSFADQFIPQFGYSYSYDRGFGLGNDKYRLSLQATLTEAGNLFSGIWSLAGAGSDKQLFGTPFSQFVKGTLQVVYTHKLMGDHKLVTRVYTGAAYAYGNSEVVPYNEQFYIGGANSIRAFAVRSIGPGSYHSTNLTNKDYYDQTGNFRFEMNMEYRFPLLGMLKGALFVDAGNIWLLENDPTRPGGQLNGKNFFRDLALGTGLGLRFDMGMIVVRGDLGVGIHLPYDTGKSGYYNMKSFGNSLAFNLAIGYPF